MRDRELCNKRLTVILSLVDLATIEYSFNFFLEADE